MKIEVWSDYVCPFCYIGKRRLEAALEQFPHRDKVEVTFKSFELDPNSSSETNLSIHEVLAKKYGTSVEQAKKMSEGVGQQATTVGLNFNFDGMKPTNTFNAHRLAKFAETKGKEAEVTESLLKSYFIDSKHIGNLETLLQITQDAELNREEVELLLSGTEFEESVRADEAEAREIGVQGVPFFVLNRKYAISGAQPTEVFLETLQKVWEEENTKTPLQTITSKTELGATCTDDGCEV
ncbi:DsbA family protein [Metabacillus herbersteinensis]|uniref:DsbA family protein n=1 Tax=Metabacillus herbersteinensis TaxID=283816 RepID=A0ABV6GL50_9BACI